MYIRNEQFPVGRTYGNDGDELGIRKDVTDIIKRVISEQTQDR